MKKLSFLAALAAILLFSAAPVHAEPLTGDGENGETIFNHQCGACHSLNANRVGPKLAGVYGRKAGTADGFNYSSAVKGSNITWDAASLDKWLTNPRDFLPGQKMNFNISDPQKRADVIAYLKKQSEPGK